MKTIIKTEKLSKIYHPFSIREKVAVDQVSLDIKEGEFITIMGKSGSGKTTLLNVLSTIDDLTKGKLFILGHNIFEMSENEKAQFRKVTLGFIFQDYHLLDTLTIYENIILPLRLAKKEYHKEKIDKIINELEISDILDKYPVECSGGQLQRVAAARTLAVEPKIIFADEPTGNLDGVRARQFMQYLQKINLEYHITIIMVTHDPLMASYSSQMYYLEDGRIKEHIQKTDDQDKYFHDIITISTETDTDHS